MALSEMRWAYERPQKTRSEGDQLIMIFCFNLDLRLALCTPAHSCARHALEPLRTHDCQHRCDVSQHVRLRRSYLQTKIPDLLLTSMSPAVLLRSIENT